MSTPFRDITLSIPTPYSNDTPQYWEEISVQNFVSDLYVRKMNGYKPPNTTRVCIQPHYYKIWDRTWKDGSIVSIACEFIRNKYESLDKPGRYRYILDIIQTAMIQLSDEYNWDKSIIEKAYHDVLNCNFIFKIDFPRKTSRDKKKAAHLCIEKTETTTSTFALIENGSSSFKIKLFDKKNSWWYDCVYLLAKDAKWKDSNRFGIFYLKGELEIYYSVNENKVFLFHSGIEVQHIDFGKIFWFQ